MRLGLLTMEIRTFKEGELLLLDVHPMLRWYIQQHLTGRDPALLERYGQVYEHQARQANQNDGGYDQSARMRYLVRQSLPDFEAALQYLSPAEKSSLAYHLAQPYRRLGQNRHALALYQQALEIYQELGDVSGVAATQHTMAGVLRQLGKPQEALALYEQALRTYQELGDVRGVAATQNAMADVLSQLGKPQEALALYEQALRTKQELGDVREVAVTQNAMAGVLSDLGKPQEALALYEQALRTTQELGEVRGVGVTQANFSQFLLQQGELQRALRMLWESFNSLRQSGFSHDAQSVQRLLIALKEQDLGPEQFTKLWAEMITEPQPAWLASLQARSSSRQAGLSSDQLNTMVANTITVMTAMPVKRADWHGRLEEALKQAQKANQVQETEFFVALLALLDGQPSSLTEDHPYAHAFNEIQAGIAAGVSQSNGSTVSVADEVIQAIRAFVNAE